MSLTKILLKEFMEDQNADYINLRSTYGTYAIDNPDIKNKIKPMEWAKLYYPVDERIEDEYPAKKFLPRYRTKTSDTYKRGDDRIINLSIKGYKFQSEDSSNPANGMVINTILSRIRDSVELTIMKRMEINNRRGYDKHGAEIEKEHIKKGNAIINYYKNKRSTLYKNGFKKLFDIIKNSEGNIIKNPEQYEKKVANITKDFYGAILKSANEKTIYLDHSLYYLLFYNKYALIEIDEPHIETTKGYAPMESAGDQEDFLNKMHKAKKISQNALG